MALRTLPPMRRRIDLIGIGLLHELTCAHAAHGDENDDNILKRNGHRVLEDVLEKFAPVAQAQVIQQGLHDGSVAWIADGAIVQISHLAGERFAQRAKARPTC